MANVTASFFQCVFRSSICVGTRTGEFFCRSQRLEGIQRNQGAPVLERRPVRRRVSAGELMRWAADCRSFAQDGTKPHRARTHSGSEDSRERRMKSAGSRGLVPASACENAAMNDDSSLREAAIRHYLATGDRDRSHGGWGRTFLEAEQNCSAALSEALIGEVKARTATVDLSRRMIPADLEHLARDKIEPMVQGLFPPAEQAILLRTLEQSVVFVTPQNVERVLRAQPYLSTAWALANMYLESVGAEPFSPADSIVGLGEGTASYVSLAYFDECDEFADFIVHEAAHVFHNCKRVRLGLPEQRRSEWLLDIAFGKRETFAYTCEAYSRIVRLAQTRAGRLEALARHAAGRLPGDERVDQDEYLDILREAVGAHNGWQRIAKRCAPVRQPRRRVTA